jgi:Ca2+-binding EF-hand superfamily protein
MITTAVVTALALAAAPPPEPAPASSEPAAPHHLILLAENRPIFLRLNVTSRQRPFEASWIESIRMLHATLDKNGNGRLEPKEADPATIIALVRLATGVTMPKLEPMDVHPKDGAISVDELAEPLRRTLGPFQLQVARQAIGRTDALFEQLDRDKDGELTKPELTAVAGSLRPLDLDDDETISASELESSTSAALTAGTESSPMSRAESTAVPPVIDPSAGESSLRLARFFLKKYDKGNGDIPGRPDNKLSPSEFAIDSETFEHFDTNRDDALEVSELRKLITSPPTDITLDVELPPDPSGQATVNVRKDDGSLSKGTEVRRLAERDVEFAIGQVRLDIHIDDGNTATEEARRVAQQLFKAADANKDGYLETKEQPRLTGARSPFAGLLALIDRDGDGKIYLKELIDFTDRQTKLARSRLIVTTADQGRAIFGILDLDRDQRLGCREVMRALDRVISWDSDHNDRVSPDEIPYHFQVSISRSGLIGLIGQGAVVTAVPRSMAADRAVGPVVGPDWFQKMDRNHDGDISRREFLGARAQFDRLDRDQDGLIDAEEALAASPEKAKP